MYIIEATVMDSLKVIKKSNKTKVNDAITEIRIKLKEEYPNSDIWIYKIEKNETRDS